MKLQFKGEYLTSTGARVTICDVISGRAAKYRGQCVDKDGSTFLAHFYDDGRCDSFNGLSDPGNIVSDAINPNVAAALAAIAAAGNTPLPTLIDPFAGVDMSVAGYEKLADVLQRAYNQAAIGKGKERHATDDPFHEQVMQIGARKFGTGALLFQAFKKSEESQRLPKDRAVAELLGSMVYLAGAVIALEAGDKRDA